MPARPASIEIAIDPPLLLIRMTLGGFFSVADVEKLDAERHAALLRLRCGLNQHLSLVDVRACELSTPEVAAALQKMLGNPIYRSRRCALILNGALARMQARRVVQRADVAMFDDVDAATAWLLAPDARECAA